VRNQGGDLCINLLDRNLPWHHGYNRLSIHPSLSSTFLINPSSIITHPGCLLRPAPFRHPCKTAWPPTTLRHRCPDAYCLTGIARARLHSKSSALPSGHWTLAPTAATDNVSLQHVNSDVACWLHGESIQPSKRTGPKPHEPAPSASGGSPTTSCHPPGRLTIDRRKFAHKCCRYL